MISDDTPTPPEPHQTEAIRAILDAHETHDRVLIVMPTGTGKTYTFSWWLQSMIRGRGGRGLVVAHRTELVQQAAASLRRWGLTVDIEQGQLRARRRALTQLSDVVVASVATLRGRRLESWDADAFRWLVTDEAHHTTASTWRAVLDRFSKAKALGVTATPDRADEVGLQHVWDTCAYTMQTADAIAAGMLVPPRVLQVTCSALDYSQVRSTRGDLSERDLEAALAVDGVAHQICGPLVREAGDRKTVIFTPTVAAAHQLGEVLAGYTEAERIATIDGTTHRDDRASILHRYEQGDVQFLLNCMVLTEGWDSPVTSCLALARATKSRALMAQMVGRALRPIRDETGAKRLDLKPDALILDFAGSTGTHSLVTPAEALAGKDLSDDVHAVQQTAEGKAALERGDIETLSALARERSEQREIELEARREKARIKAETEYTTQRVDLLRLQASGAKMQQIKQLEQLGADLSKVRDAAHARRIMDWDQRCKAQGLASFRQRKLLKRMGLNMYLDRDEAKKVIVAVKNNNWKVPPGIRAKHGGGR